MKKLTPEQTIEIAQGRGPMIGALTTERADLIERNKALQDKLNEARMAKWWAERKVERYRVLVGDLQELLVKHDPPPIVEP